MLFKVKNHRNTGGAEPNIHPTAFVAPNAVIIGDVTLEANSSVWFNCVLRGDSGAIRIGEGTNVQDGAVLHEETIIGKNCVLAHMTLVHRCVVGDNVLIGNGALIFGPAEIGEGAVIGAGAVVTPGAKIPPNTMWLGIPAKQIKDVDDNLHQMTRRLGEAYASNRATYLEGLEPLDDAAKRLMASL